MTGYIPTPPGMVAEDLEDVIAELSDQLTGRIVAGDVKGALVTLLAQNHALTEAVRFLLLRDEPDEDVLDRLATVRAIGRCPCE